MKVFLRVIVLLHILSIGFAVQAQDTLPDFAVKNINGKVILSWVNNFPVIKQISIQRSADSVKGFKTILTLPDASSVTNGFLDNNAPNIYSFYKLYILLDSGKYIFSKSKKPVKSLPSADPAVNASAPPGAQQSKEENKGAASLIKPEAKESLAKAEIKPQPENVPAELPSKQYSKENAIVSVKKRSDGLKADTTSVKRAEIFTPSGFIYTNPDGNVTIVLPLGKSNIFNIKFYDETGNFLFQINNIKEHLFILDKSNFMRSGWFKFEIYEDGILKEKNKILIPKNPAIR